MSFERIIQERRHQKTEKSDLISVLLSWRDEEIDMGLSSQLLRELLLWILLPALILFSISLCAYIDYNLLLMQIALVVAMVAQVYCLKLVSGHPV